MRDEKPVDRRRFFREALGEFLRPVARAIDPSEKAAHHLSLDHATGDKPSDLSAYAPTDREHWLRPPGARPEGEFQTICSRCGDCVSVCPARCIRIESDPDGRGGGVPFIDPDAMPCVLCDGLLCMATCPTTALVPTPLEMIDMGTAHWRQELCLRSHGQDCTICVDRCPVGPKALELNGAAVVVHRDACTGCGVCQNSCPTEPKSIIVTPRSARD